jgi:FOG: PKD repeat
VGYTNSTDFPNTTGGAQANYGGGQRDAFVAKLNPDLTQILQSTYLGGSVFDEATALAIHPTTGDVYVVGWTSSTNFPNTTGGAQTRFGGDLSDAFVTKLSADLTFNLQSAYPERTNNDWGRDFAIHPKTGDVYVVGYTQSNNFPKATSKSQESKGGKEDVFVARLTANLAATGGSDGGSGSGGGRRIRGR